MPDLAYTQPQTQRSIMVVQWTGLIQSQNGVPWIAGFDAHMADRTVHIFGTLGPATIIWQGSNETVSIPLNWVTLTDPLENLMSFNTGLPKLAQILQSCYQVRPSVTGGDGTTNLTVILFLAAGGK